MPYLTLRKKSKATIKRWFSRLLRHPARKRSGSILGYKTHTHIYLLTYFPRTHTGKSSHWVASLYTHQIPLLLQVAWATTLSLPQHLFIYIINSYTHTRSVCGWQVKLCDPTVAHRLHLSALVIKGL